MWFPKGNSLVEYEKTISKFALNQLGKYLQGAKKYWYLLYSFVIEILYLYLRLISRLELQKIGNAYFIKIPLTSRL